MNIERTFVALKPDAVQRGLIGRIVNRFEEKGFKIIAMKMLEVTPEQAAAHYAEHVGKPFYDGLIQFIGSIRADYSPLMKCNCIHASDSVDSAEREMRIYFDVEKELCTNWKTMMEVVLDGLQ